MYQLQLPLEPENCSFMTLSGFLTGSSYLHKAEYKRNASCLLFLPPGSGSSSTILSAYRLSDPLQCFKFLPVGVWYHVKKLIKCLGKEALPHRPQAPKKTLQVLYVICILICVDINMHFAIDIWILMLMKLWC
jgi:hypothetical protein